MKKYIVYLTTNLVNNKIYVGVHGTEDPDKFDGYIGNSINIFNPNPELKHPKFPFHKAVKKYGYSAFRRLTLLVFDTKEEALYLEALIVNEEFINRPDTYNATLGGGMPPINNKVIYQYDLDGNFIKKWDSILDVNTFYNTNTSISIAAIYKRTSLNSLWSYEKYDKLNLDEYKVYNPEIPVYIYDLDGNFVKEFKSMSECVKGLDTNLIKVQRNSKLGLPIGEYYISLKLYSKYVKPVFNLTGEIHQYTAKGEYIKSYKDSKELKKTGYRISDVNRSIKMDRIYQNSLWARGDKLDYLPSKEKDLKITRKVGQYTIDGLLVKIFNTVREARKEFPNVSKVLNGSAKHCHNFMFKYIS